MEPPKEHQEPRTRVNGVFLYNFHDKPVCLLGTVIKGEAGSSFQVKSSDGQQINVRLKQGALTEPISGLIEVYGTGQGRNLIRADSFTLFPEAIAQSFDMNAYNEMVTILHTMPNPYVTPVT